MLKNGDFSSRNWRDIKALQTNLKNQEPDGWRLVWLEPGEALFGDPNAQALGVPECVHKLKTQLPAHEQMGQPNALILAGDATYKIFNANAPFGAALSQTVEGLQPGTTATLTVPIQAHLHGETDAFGAESGVWINGEGGWVNGFDMGDRRWHKHKIEFSVPDHGMAEIVIRVKSKWPRPKDFFIDGIELEGETAVAPPTDDDDDELPIKTVIVKLPPGVEIRQGVSSEAHVIEVNVGPGVVVEVE